MRKALSVFCFLTVAFAADKYTGPLPPKADIPYLLHADNLMETETSEAKEETRKDSQLAIVPGATSKARTPLAEPVLIFRSGKIPAEKMQAYRMEVRDGNREVVVSHKKGKGMARPIFLSINKIGERLYKIEVDQPLENGEYTLSPDGSSEAFSFTIY